ncbi:type I 3-dehydroquinase domain-containing protein [Sarocladium implicatum]|nr:type I 3-dehydroquinase domain-containing protein [Sarocladium implicatum]
MDFIQPAVRLGEFQSPTTDAKTALLSTSQLHHTSSDLTFPSHDRIFDSRASIILIGARAAGKRSLGFIAAAQLGRRFLSEGLYFFEHTGLSQTDYFQKHGAKTFNVKHMEVFRQMLEENAQGCIIECGIASLAREARRVLKHFARTHPVIHITRNFDHISQLTKVKSTTAESLRRAETQDRDCSNLEFYNLYDPSCRSGTEETDFSPSSLFVLRDVKLDFQIFIRLVTGRLSLDRRHPASVSAIPLEKRNYTYSAVLRMSELARSKTTLDRIESGEDAIEFRIDVQLPNMFTAIGKFISQIRRSTRLPLIYSVERAVVAASPDPELAYFELIEHGLRFGVEYVQLDLSCPRRLIEQVIHNKGYAKVIGTQHFDTIEPGSWLQDHRLHAYRTARDYNVDIIQFTQPAISRQDNMDVHVFSHQASREGNGRPLIAYNTGQLGKTSLVFNRILTPVKLTGPETKDSLIQSNEATSALFRCFEFDRLQFHVFGTPCGAQPAPSIYASIFHILGLEHKFDNDPAASLDKHISYMQQPTFGGCIVSSSHKVEASKFVHSSSKHAAIIGAVNTIMPLRPRPDGSIPPFEEQSSQRNRSGPVAALYGENTDWIGIMRCFQRKSSPRNVANASRGSCIVIGAGGAARSAIYAMMHLGYQHIFIYNRTQESAQRLADHFNTHLQSPDPMYPRRVSVLPYGRREWDTELPAPTAIMSCIPAAAMSDLIFPESWFQSSSGGVVGDVTYGDSFLLQKTRRWRNEQASAWEVFNGFDILVEHGSIQFELLTERRAPTRMLSKLVY